MTGNGRSAFAPPAEIILARRDGTQWTAIAADHGLVERIRKRIVRRCKGDRADWVLLMSPSGFDRLKRAVLEYEDAVGGGIASWDPLVEIRVTEEPLSDGPEAALRGLG